MDSVPVITSPNSPTNHMWMGGLVAAIFGKDNYHKDFSFLPLKTAI
jgi:hypothetical protein